MKNKEVAKKIVEKNSEKIVEKNSEKNVDKRSLAYWQSLPTLRQGHFEDLKFESQERRSWLSRMTIEDGAPYNNQVIEEIYVLGHWIVVERYEAK